MRTFALNTAFPQDHKYPITLHSACVHHIQETVKGRVMPFHQILLVLDGKGTLYCNGKSYTLQKGCAFFTSSYTPVEYVNNGGLISAYLTVTGSAVAELAESFASDGLLFFENTNIQKFISLIKQIIFSYHFDCNQGALSVLAYSFFVEFLSQQNSNAPEWLNETVKYINLHFHEKLTLAELANLSFISVSKLCHNFKKAYSVSVFEYIMDVRLQHARATLLAFPDTMIKDVAEQCGFFDVGYFCKMYRKKYGKTPSEEKQD